MLITIARFTEPVEANIVRALLASEGIAASLGSEHHATAVYPLSQALGGVAVQVAEADAEAALALLAAYQSGELQRELEAQFDLVPDACPSCGSENIHWSVAGADKAVAAAVAVTIGVVYPVRASSGRCQACGHHWQREA